MREREREREKERYMICALGTSSLLANSSACTPFSRALCNGEGQWPIQDSRIRVFA
jgi:hypothetical protein